MYTYDDLFNLFWNKGSYSFDRAVHDMYPYKIKKEKDKLVLIHNVVGINEDDLIIDIEEKDGKHYLVVKGDTKDEVFGDYSINSSFEIKPNSFEKIQYEVKNGILRVYLFKKEPEEKTLQIEKM